MVTFRLVEETEQYLIYWYFPDGHEDEMHGIILIDKLNGTVEIPKMAHNDFSHIVTVAEQNELRDSVNDMRREEGLSLLTEEEWPSATTEFTKTFFADHAISKIIEGYNSGNRFSTLFVILFRSFIYFQATEKPVEPKFYGYLTFGHNVILR